MLASGAVIAALRTIEARRHGRRIARAIRASRHTGQRRTARACPLARARVDRHDARAGCSFASRITPACGAATAAPIFGATGRARQISHDHSEVQDLIDRGVLDAVEAKTWPRRNVVTRAIGVAVEAEFELGEGPISAGDRFLLCSDGLTNHVDGRRNRRRAWRRATEAGVCEDLIALTLQRGASDNVSLIIVACDFDFVDGTRRILARRGRRRRMGTERSTVVDKPKHCPRSLAEALSMAALSAAAHVRRCLSFRDRSRRSARWRGGRRRLRRNGRPLRRKP